MNVGPHLERYISTNGALKKAAKECFEKIQYENNVMTVSPQFAPLPEVRQILPSKQAQVYKTWVKTLQEHEDVCSAFKAVYQALDPSRVAGLLECDGFTLKRERGLSLHRRHQGIQDSKCPSISTCFILDFH